MKGENIKRKKIGGLVLTILIAILVLSIVKKPMEKYRGSFLNEKGSSIVPLEDEGISYFLKKGLMLGTKEITHEKRLVVYAIMENSEGEKAGILPGDYLIQVNGYETRSIEEAYKYINKEKENEIVLKRTGRYYKIKI